MKIHTYVKAGRALMDAFGVRHVFLVTDSQGAVDEAMACAREHPDICRDLTFRFLDKKRWVGAEGGMWGLVEAGRLSKLITAQGGRTRFPRGAREWSFWTFRRSSRWLRGARWRS